MYEQQLHLEGLSLSKGVSAYWERIEKRGQADTSVGVRYIRSLVLPLAEAIEHWRSSAALGASPIRAEVVPLLDGVCSKELAYLTIRTCLMGARTGRGMQYPTIAVSLGRLVEDHSRWVQVMKDKDINGYFHVIAQRLAKSTSERHKRGVVRDAMAKKSNIPSWSTRTAAIVGAHLIERCIATTGHFTKRMEEKGPKSKCYLELHPEVVTHLEAAHDRAALLSPIWGPMLVKPMEWHNGHDGGYLTLRLPLIKPAGMGRENAHQPLPSPEILAAVNYIQSVPWRIHQGVAQVLHDAWAMGGGIAGLPTADMAPLPAKPDDINENPVSLKEWKRRASDVYTANGRTVTKRLSILSLLDEVDTFKGQDAIYFPHQLDWRGRMYPVSSGLNPQGPDWVRAVLCFAEGKPLGQTGVYWLAVHLANMWGHDKVSLDERARWVAENTDGILEAALAPLGGSRWWTQADKPWCFLAACFEWAGYVMQGPDYVSHLPVHVDGSCNGLQHYAAILKDRASAEAVNLGVSDKPQDVYTRVAKRATALLQGMADDEAAACLAEWPDGIPRFIAKRPVMTLPYGVTKYGMANHIVEELQSAGLFAEKRTGAATVLAGVVYDGIGDVIAAAREAMTWLQQCADAFSAKGKLVQWVTPSGLQILQDYRVTGTERVNVFIGGQRIQVQLHYLTGSLNSRRQRNGIAPNFVHSMDAAHLVDTLLRLQADDIRSVAAVHDSYATLACDMPALNGHLREAFVDMYSVDQLRNLYDQFIAQGVDVPEPPPMGDFDITEVLRSEFFFA